MCRLDLTIGPAILRSGVNGNVEETPMRNSRSLCFHIVRVWDWNNPSTSSQYFPLLGYSSPRSRRVKGWCRSCKNVMWLTLFTITSLLISLFSYLSTVVLFPKAFYHFTLSHKRFASPHRSFSSVPSLYRTLLPPYVLLHRTVLRCSPFSQTTVVWFFSRLLFRPLS